MPLKELLQEFVDKSYEELVGIASAAFLSLFDELERLANGNTELSAYVVGGYCAAAVSADGKISEIENKFLREVLNLNDSSVDYSFELGKDPKFVDILDEMFDTGTIELKKSALVFCLSLIAIDENINRDEVAFIEKLLN